MIESAKIMFLKKFSVSPGRYLANTTTLTDNGDKKTGIACPKIARLKYEILRLISDASPGFGYIKTSSTYEIGKRSIRKRYFLYTII